MAHTTFPKDDQFIFLLPEASIYSRDDDHVISFSSSIFSERYTLKINSVKILL